MDGARTSYPFTARSAGFAIRCTDSQRDGIRAVCARAARMQLGFGSQVSPQQCNGVFGGKRRKERRTVTDLYRSVRFPVPGSDTCVATSLDPPVRTHRPPVDQIDRA